MARLGVHAEPDGGQVRGARLGFLARGGDHPADAAPGVQLIRQIEWKHQVAVLPRRGGASRTVAGRDVRRDRRGGGDGGVQVGAVQADGGARFPETGFRGLHRLVRRVHLRLQIVELGVAEDLPPDPAAARDRPVGPASSLRTLYRTPAIARGRPAPWVPAARCISVPPCSLAATG